MATLHERLASARQETTDLPECIDSTEEVDFEPPSPISDGDSVDRVEDGGDDGETFNLEWGQLVELVPDYLDRLGLDDHALSNLTKLFLQHNELETLQTLFCLPLDRLQHLDLSANCLRTIEFTGDYANTRSLISLTYLNLNDNNIRVLGSGLTRLPKLKTLLLANNNVRIAKNCEMMHDLGTLNLENNQISKVMGVRSLSINANLTSLILAGNPLSSARMYRRTIASLMPSVETLDGDPLKYSKARGKKERFAAKGGRMHPGRQGGAEDGNRTARHHHTNDLSRISTHSSSCNSSSSSVHHSALNIRTNPAAFRGVLPRGAAPAPGPGGGTDVGKGPPSSPPSDQKPGQTSTDVDGGGGDGGSGGGGADAAGCGFRTGVAAMVTPSPGRRPGHVAAQKSADRQRSRPRLTVDQERRKVAEREERALYLQQATVRKHQLLLRQRRERSLIAMSFASEGGSNSNKQSQQVVRW
jgi:hypothetical protein